MKKIICLILAISILLLPLSIFAVTSSEVQTQIDSTKSKIQKTQNELKNNQKEQKNVLGEINTLDKNINTTEDEIETTENRIKELEQGIVIAEENIEYMQEEYDKKMDIRVDRALEFFKNGSISLWDSVGEISDPADKIFAEKMIEIVSDYDMDVMNELEKERIEIEEEKAGLEEDKIECAELKSSLEVKLASLNETVEKRTKYLAELEKNEDLLEESIDELNKKADELEAELKKIASSSTNSKYTGGTMTWPLPGYYTITSQFGNRLHPILKVYKLHTGVDIAGSGCNGKDVVAAANGKVITAAYLSGYGNTIMIDHGGGIVTLYAHSSKLLVKVGDTVKAGQTIMKVGTTGNSTGPHLHFEVRVDGKYVNPLDGYIKSK